MENPETLSRRIPHVALKWSEIRRVVDAAVIDTYWSSRGGKGRGGGDGRENRECCERLGERGPSEPAHDQRGSTETYLGRQDGFSIK